MRRARSAARLARLLQALSPVRCSGRIRGRPRPPGRATRTASISPTSWVVSASCPGVSRVARSRPRPSQIVWSLVVSPPRDRPNACWRHAWIDAIPPCGHRRRAGGPGPRWSRSGRPSPAPRPHPPGCATPPRCGPRCHRSAGARTAYRPSPRAHSARADPATAPAAHPEQDAVEDLAVIPPAPTTLGRHRGQQRRKPLPLLVGDLKSPVHAGFYRTTCTRPNSPNDPRNMP
jgi:hypothetical protein